MPAEPGSVEQTDGRKRKGDRRRQRLLAATIRLVARAGVAGVTQRAVAAEAELPPSAVLYYFSTVDELLVATLTAVNDHYLRTFDGLPADRPGVLGALADLITADRDRVLAEYELWLLAARRPELRPELGRWTAALDALAARLVDDPVRRLGFAAANDGLFLRAASSPEPPDPAGTAAVLALLTEPDKDRT
jgi:DNA-binding transcriptional regulator YbjK